MKGYVDLQVNGFSGIDFSSPGLTIDMVSTVVEALKKRGTDIFCPTLITANRDIYRTNLPVLAAAMEDPALAPHIAGLHLEGPFLAPESAGAHPKKHLQMPEADLFKQWQELARGNIRILTIAPELPGAERVIKEASGSGVIVGLGHHMAGHESIMRAVENGARLCTHLGNGIANSLPRHPNPLWTQLACDELAASFITDGHHLPPEFIKVAWRAKGPERFILTSDAAPVAGCKPGLYDLWNQQVRVDKNGSIRLPDGSALAGSSVQISDCVHFFRSCTDPSQAELERVARRNALELLKGAR